MDGGIMASKLEKRSQAERLIIAESLLEGIWAEFLDGKIDKDIIQTAVNAQVSINRIVWKLNQSEGDD